MPFLGQYDRDFEAINNQMLNEQEEDTPITDEFRITALDYNHDFHNFETPNTNGSFHILIGHCNSKFSRNCGLLEQFDST